MTKIMRRHVGVSITFYRIKRKVMMVHEGRKFLTSKYKRSLSIED